jgi:ethanolamine ammonia-lyase small subunit
MSDSPLSPVGLPEAVRQALARTPARLLAGRAGTGYRTATALQLRQDHAAARDAVLTDVDWLEAFGAERIGRFGLFPVTSRAATRKEFLSRPDLGRLLSDESRGSVRANCPTGRDVQIVVGDGLSSAAVATQAPRILDILFQEGERVGWRMGRPFLVRNCRVGLMNEIGGLLDPTVVILLIGERPGLATAESLSAYLAYRPRPGHTDAHRNLISNIHDRGVRVEEAAARIAALAETMRRKKTSGVTLKEESPMIGGQPSDATPLR